MSSLPISGLAEQGGDMNTEHNYTYPGDCPHPDCMSRRINRMNTEIKRWNLANPDKPPKPIFRA